MNIDYGVKWNSTKPWCPWNGPIRSSDVCNIVEASVYHLIDNQNVRIVRVSKQSLDNILEGINGYQNMLLTFDALKNANRVLSNLILDNGEAREAFEVEIILLVIGVSIDQTIAKYCGKYKDSDTSGHIWSYSQREEG